MDSDLGFPVIVYRDGAWFLRYVWCGELRGEIMLPNHPMMNRIWQTSADLLRVYVDDHGAQPHCHEFLRKAAKAFAGISQLLFDEAEQDELNMLYEDDENELWYQK